MNRFFEIIPGFLAWTTIVLVILLSLLLPAAVAIFIILFDIYWLFKTIYLSFHLRATFKKMRENLNINWLNKLHVSGFRFHEIYHLVILPMYKEPYEVVKQSFECLMRANYSRDKFIVVLAIEERAGEQTKETARKIETEFGGAFFKFLITVHPGDIPGELPGKGSNETWAAKEAKRLIIDPLINAQTDADYTQTNAEGAEKEFLYQDLTYKIRGAVFSVKKQLGLGHKENVYQKALEEEFKRLNLNFKKEKSIEILYGEKEIGFYRPDFIVEDKIILEIKSLPFAGKFEKRQVWQYLKGSSYKLALLVNFAKNDISIKRIVYDTARELPRKSAFSQRKSALDYNSILVSVFDIDTQVPPDYFSRLTYAYFTSPRPERSSFQPIPLFNNNIYEAPALGRVIAFSSTFWQMMQQARPERLTTFSSHSMPFAALTEIGFWNTNIVSEDSQIFWQCFLHYDGDWRVVPLEYPVSMDANVAPTFWQTMLNLYKQQRRWGWGCENIPYMLFGFSKNKKIPKRKKLYWTFNVLEGFHSWATNALMIFALGWLPLFLGGQSFNFTLLSYNLPQVTRFIMTLSMLGIATSAILSIILLPPRPNWFRPWHYPLYFFQWVLMPLTLIIFGALPGLEAQTRLALGGKFRLGFWATPKRR